MYRNIILTGLPRSGTSLTCSLLSKQENTLALIEPMNVFECNPSHGIIEACHFVNDFFFETRRKILQERKIDTGLIQGKIGDNTFEDNPTGKLRKPVISYGEYTINKPLTYDFNLLIKHTAFFASILDSLRIFFECYASIRNPLSVLLSWATIDVPIHYGHIPAAERFDPQLQESLEVTSDILDRQLIILEWFFRKFDKNLPKNNILLYEETIRTGSKNLNTLSYNPSNYQAFDLENKNVSKKYKHIDIERIYRKLLETDGVFWKYYSRKYIDMIFNEAFEG